MIKKTFSLLVFSFFLASPLLFSGCWEDGGVAAPYELTLEVWGVFDDSDAFTEINSAFADKTATVSSVQYRKISSRTEDYEKELLDALSAGNGPDVLFFKNTWLLKHQNKIVPLPDSSEKISGFKQTFIDSAFEDFVMGNQIYAMPLFSDNLALFYNKNIFNQAGIASPPRTWKEVSNLVPTLTKIDEFGNIQQSAIALGRSKDPGGINRAGDVLMLMMMQKGATLFDSTTGQADFFRHSSLTDSSNPALQAFDFFMTFSQGGSPNYSWNSKMDYSIDSFRFGKLAMMINYQYMAEDLRMLDPKLNFEVAPVPQDDLANKASYANYWGLAVSRNKSLEKNQEKGNYSNQDRINEAWKYIQYITAQSNLPGELTDPNQNYLEKTGKVAARRDLLEKQKTDPQLGAFALQALFSHSWKQKDDSAVDQILFDMINEVTAGKTTTERALKNAESRINVLK